MNKRALFAILLLATLATYTTSQNSMLTTEELPESMAADGIPVAKLSELDALVRSVFGRFLAGG